MNKEDKTDKELDLSVQNIRRITKDDMFKLPPDIETIDLSRNLIVELEPYSLQHFGALKALDLSCKLEKSKHVRRMLSRNIGD